MELSIFLAKLLGLYLLIVAADLLLRKHELEKALKDFASSKGLLVFSGSMSLLIGLTITIAHPIYTQDWRGLITLVGYVLIFRGVIRMVFPSFLQKRIVPLFHKRHLIIVLILLVVGGYLTYSGFSAV
jgi:Na+/melibiose symporter-like transporter